MSSLFAAFSDEQAERLTGITRSQLRYWDRTQFFRPSFSTDGNYRAGFGRVYSFGDIVALRVIRALRHQFGISTQHLRQVGARLTAAGFDGWTGLKLYPINRRVHWLEPGTGLPQDVVTGQLLVPIDLDAVIAGTKDDVRKLARRDPETVGRIAQNRRINKNAPVVAGTRVPVRAVRRFHDAGYSVEHIIREYPDLTREDIEAALAYQQAA